MDTQSVSIGPVCSKMAVPCGLPHNLAQMSPEERRQSLPMLASLFVPLDYMYAVYDQLYRAIRETYTTRTAMEEKQSDGHSIRKYRTCLQ